MNKKKTISVILSIIMLMTTFFIEGIKPVIAVAEDAESVSLSSDGFENYVDEYDDELTAVERVGNKNDDWSGYNNDLFKTYYNAMIEHQESWEKYIYTDVYNLVPKDRNAELKDKVFNISSVDGFGEGKSLDIKTYSQMNSYAMFKKSNIGNAAFDIENVGIEFSFKFKIPSTGLKRSGEGVGIWLADDEVKPSKYALTATWGSMPTENKLGQLIALSSGGSASETVKLYSFGQQITNVSRDTEYLFKLTITPKDGAYTASASLNGVRCVNAPDPSGLTSDMLKRYNHIAVLVQHSKGSIYSDISKLTDEQKQAENTAGTLSDGKYMNGNSMIYMDDMLLSVNRNAASPDDPDDTEASTLFEDDFNIITNIIDKGTDYTSKSGEYDKNTFVRHGMANIYQSLFPDNENFDDYKETFPDHAGDIDKTANVNNGVLTITRQGARDYALVKKSNIDKDKIRGKELVFEMNFSLPGSGGKYNFTSTGEGVGVWLAEAKSKGGSFGPSPSSDMGAWPNRYFGVGTDKDSWNEQKRLFSMRPASYNSEIMTVYFLGDSMQFSNGYPGKEYKYILRMIPDELNSKYTAIAAIYDEDRNILCSKAVETDSMPTPAELGENFKYVSISTFAHPYTIKNDMKPFNDVYRNDVELFKIDGLKMSAVNTFEINRLEGLNSFGEISMSDKSLSVVMTSDIDAESLSTNNFSIDEGAYIESASVNPDDSKIIDLKLGGVKPNKSYSIELKDIFNKLNISLSDCISLKTSDGFDCKGIMLNGSENGNVQSGNNNLKVSISKSSEISEKFNPVVIAVVYKEIDGAYKCMGVYSASEKIDDNGTVEVNNISAASGDKIDVHVWRSSDDMIPISKTVSFE